MWDNTTQTGSCHSITTENIVMTSPGTSTPEMAARTQVHTKFFTKTVYTMLMRPDVFSGIENELVGVEAVCKGIKQIVCEASVGSSGSSSNGAKCTQKKAMWLLKVRADATSYGGYMNTYIQVNGQWEWQWISAPNFIGYYNDLSINQNGATFVNPCIPLTTIF